MKLTGLWLSVDGNHVMGEGRQFASTTEAIETYRKELNVVDQDLPWICYC